MSNTAPKLTTIAKTSRLLNFSPITCHASTAVQNGWVFAMIYCTRRGTSANPNVTAVKAVVPATDL